MFQCAGASHKIPALVLNSFDPQPHFNTTSLSSPVLPTATEIKASPLKLAMWLSESLFKIMAGSGEVVQPAFHLLPFLDLRTKVCGVQASAVRSHKFMIQV
jgi:hypothetical protein